MNNDNRFDILAWLRFLDLVLVISMILHTIYLALTPIIKSELNYTYQELSELLLISYSIFSLIPITIIIAATRWYMTLYTRLLKKIGQYSIIFPILLVVLFPYYLIFTDLDFSTIFGIVLISLLFVALLNLVIIFREEEQTDFDNEIKKSYLLLMLSIPISYLIGITLPFLSNFPLIIIPPIFAIRYHRVIRRDYEDDPLQEEEEELPFDKEDPRQNDS